MAEPTTPPAPTPPAPPQPTTPPVDPKNPTPPTPPAAPDAEAIRKAAKEEARRELEQEREKERKEAEAKLAREQGKFKELYEAEQAAAATAKQEAEALRNETARERAANILRRHVAEKHPEYVQCCDDFMVPLLKVDAKTTPEEVAKQAEGIAKRYVELNPRSAKGAAAPSGPTHGQRQPPEYKPSATNGNGGRLTGPVRAF